MTKLGLWRSQLGLDYNYILNSSDCSRLQIMITPSLQDTYALFFLMQYILLHIYCKNGHMYQ